MRGRLNLWLLLIAIFCAVSLWAGLGARIPLREKIPWIETRNEPEPDVEQSAPAVHLLVLNGTNHRGLARQVGLLVPRAGCLAQNIGNAPAGEHPVSLLINRRLDQDRAQRLARRLGGVPLLMEWDGRGTEDAVLLLGDDYSDLLAALGAESTLR